jgi:hypothetical protein
VGSDTANELSYQTALSECGGFWVEQYAPPPGDTDDTAEYCGAERLLWTYDPSSGALEITHTRVELNCCGVHSIDFSFADGVYLIAERDEPEVDRCTCVCVFDFGLTVQGMPQEIIAVELERTVTDAPDASGPVWSGELDLTQGNGEIIVDGTPMGYPCLP